MRLRGTWPSISPSRPAGGTTTWSSMKSRVNVGMSQPAGMVVVGIGCLGGMCQMRSSSTTERDWSRVRAILLAFARVLPVTLQFVPPRLQPLLIGIGRCWLYMLALQVSIVVGRFVLSFVSGTTCGVGSAIIGWGRFESAPVYFGLMVTSSTCLESFIISIVGMI